MFANVLLFIIIIIVIIIIIIIIIFPNLLDHQEQLKQQFIE